MVTFSGGYFFLDSQGEFLYIFSPKKQYLITSLNREVTRSDEAIQLYAQFIARVCAEEKLHESYVDNTIFIDVAGEVIGQVNALAVYQIGDRASSTEL